MRTMTNLAGICLIIIGIITLVYQGVTYTKHEKVAQIGPVEVMADTQKHIYFPPLLGGLSLVGGIFLVVIARKNRL